MKWEKQRKKEAEKVEKEKEKTKREKENIKERKEKAKKKETEKEKSKKEIITPTRKSDRSKIIRKTFDSNTNMMEIEQKTKEKDIENLYKQMMTIAENLIQNLETPMADEERLKILMNKNEQLIKITVQLAKKGHNIPLRIAEEAETYSKKYKIRKIILNVIM